MSINVSVITVCFNSADTIRNTIESVLSQDYPSIEYIIIDGGSTDQTINIIQDYSDQISTVISEADRGIYDAMNKGIQAATGDVVGMLNSDDIYSTRSSVRHLVERLVEAQTDSVFADLVFIDQVDSNHISRYYDSSRFHPERLRFGWMPAHPTFYVKRHIFENWGGYSLDYQIATDYEMMVRLFYKADITYTYLPEVVVKMRTGGVSTSGLRSSWILNKEIVRACKTNGLETNLIWVLLKMPMKLVEYFKKPRGALFCLKR